MLNGRRDHGIEGWKAHKSLPEIGISMILISQVVEEYVLCVETPSELPSTANKEFLTRR